MNVHNRDMQNNKIVLIFSTQRSGSTMVCSDFAQTKILGNPSEYFTEKILPGSNFDNCSLSPKEIKAEIDRILNKATTANGVTSIKVMSDYITEIAKALEAIGIKPKSSDSPSKQETRSPREHLKQLFVSFFNDLDVDDNFVAFRVYRKDKLKQAVSRFVAAKTGLYHVWRNAEGKLDNHYDRPENKATPFSLDIDRNYDYNKLSNIIDSIYREEKELDILFESFNIRPINIIYEEIVENTDYLKDIAKQTKLIKDLSVIGKIERKTVKTSSKINQELIQRFNRDGGYKGETYTSQGNRT